MIYNVDAIHDKLEDIGWVLGCRGTRDAWAGPPPAPPPLPACPPALRLPPARRWTEEATWEETLALTSEAPLALGNTEDDLERELAFYNQVRPCCGL